MGGAWVCRCCRGRTSWSGGGRSDRYFPSKFILIMILLNRCARLFHFARPAMSAVPSLKSLESILQNRLVSSIKEANKQTLKPYSFTGFIQHKLKVDHTPAIFMAERTINLSVFSSKNHEHRSVELRLDQDIKDLKLQAGQFGLPFSETSALMRHFSGERGAPAFQELEEYNLDERTLLLFNLPENISEQDIQVMLKEKVRGIVFKYCALGLPAYARVQFEDAQTLQKCLESTPRKIDFGERSAVVKTQKDQQKLRLANRRLAVQIEEDDNIQHMLVELSRFGRVMHIDWPLEARMNPTLEEVKQFYKDKRELIKINKVYPDGKVESQYFPDVRLWKNQDEREEDSMHNIAQRLEEVYDHRARFAKPVEVYVGQQHKLNIKSRGYFIVTFSTSEQCQNYYFTHGARTKMQLMGDKLDFEVDPVFKKEVLRIIDNEHLVGQKRKKKESEEQPDKHYQYNQQSNVFQQDDYELKEGRSVESYNLFEKLFKSYYFQAGNQSSRNFFVFNTFFQENDFMQWEDRKMTFRKAKEESTSLTFDQLAEKQLYGRVLPKDEKIQRLKVEDTKYRVPKEEQLFKDHSLITTSEEKKQKERFYNFLRERNNRRADIELGIDLSKHPQAEGEEGEGQQAQESPEDGENIGKQYFSTKRPSFLYRKRTAEEEAVYIKRFGLFVRNLIYEYMGVFQDKLVEEAVAGKVDYLNPQSLTFSDGSPLLTEEEVTDVLQFRRDLSVAQGDYTNYVFGSQYIKSNDINLREIFANYRSFEINSLSHLTQVGIIDELRKVEDDEQTVKEKAAILNTEAAEFGEEYRGETFDSQVYLAKISKLEHLVPLNRIAHLESVSQEFHENISSQQAEVFQKHYAEMKKTGVIADEVCQTFGVAKGMKVEDLIAEMGLKYGVTNKDLQMTERIRTYSREQLGEDLALQKKWGRVRGRGRKFGSSDFAKDPSEIYVKDREGYFKVSRYRQI